MVSKTRDGKPGKKTSEGIVVKEKKPRKSKGRHSYGALQQDLITRLHHVRAEAREICDSYLSNLDTDIRTLVDFLDGSSEVRQPDEAKAATMDTWAAILDDLKLKPDKGRRKDLRKIDAAVRALMKSAFD